MINEIAQFIQANFIISVAVFTFIIVQVVKQFVTDKRYMYVVALILGVGGAVALNEAVSFEIVVAGLASGSIAIVTYDYGFEKLFNNDNAEDYRKGE